MNLAEIKKGNYLLHHNEIVKVRSIDVDRKLIYTNKRPAPFSITALKPVKLEEVSKGKLIHENFKSDVDEFLLSLQYRKDLPLHTFQNELLDNYNKYLKINDAMMQDLQQSQ